MRRMISASAFADIAGVSRATIGKWERKGEYVPEVDSLTGRKYFYTDQLTSFPAIKAMNASRWDEELATVPLREYTSVELFAGAGGLALGMEQAGFRHVLLNEIDPSACATLRMNRPEWCVAEQDIATISFRPWCGKVDFLSGGFPCQAFSYAGKQGGFADTRGTLFFELARAVREIEPKVFMCENVRGLAAHDGGRTLDVIKAEIRSMGYTLIEPRVLKAILYKVPQKRERLILIAVRNDLADKAVYKWPDPYYKVMTLRDAFFKGELYDCDVPPSPGQRYPKRKEEVMRLVPEGGDWRDLPEDVRREYMKGSYNLGGGKTGMARRLAFDSPSLTLTCAPAMKQTERCHPTETRPLTVREYARIQTFPDSWQFAGSLQAEYKQIGNAVPVNLAAAVGRSIIRLLNDIERATTPHGEER
ncbi:MAG: DNA (cytosine-5-)-methyltransferase [Prevotella sp.]|nr:DNA (cytosine-5-)-methyltransferase [Prevotella sp.]